MNAALESIAELARTLKQERDQARADATALAERLTALELSSTADLAALERERDEARGELARIESLLLDPHAVFVNFLHGKIAKLDWEKLEHIHGPHPARVERDEWAKICALYKQERDQSREALRRIADCDWVISLPDRMDAVRKIARDALEGTK